jgi:hypothetical protein
VGSWPSSAATTQTFEPAGASAGTVAAPFQVPVFPTPLSSDDIAELKVPSTVPQRNIRSVSLKSASFHEALKLMLDPGATDEPPAGVLVMWREPLWAAPR